MSKADGLISLSDCQPENLLWISGWYDAAHKKPTGWHLYQFGTRSAAALFAWYDIDKLPAVQPPCRAPSFKRSNHMPWKTRSGDRFEDYVPDPRREGDYWCHKCIVEVVMKFPHIFTGERK